MVMLLVLTVTSTSAAQPAQDTASAPPVTVPTVACSATYDLLINGKRAGSLVSELKPLGEQRWEYVLTTEARRGLVKASVKQNGQFERNHSSVRPLSFSSRQKVAFAKRNSDASYDWTTMTASGTHKGDDWTIDMPPQFVDRLTINERLRLDLATDPAREQFDYVRLDRGRLRDMVFERQTTEQIAVPAGEFATQKVTRRHDSDDRRTASWHAPALNYLPIRIEQMEDKRLTVSELTKVAGCR